MDSLFKHFIVMEVDYALLVKTSKQFTDSDFLHHAFDLMALHSELVLILSGLTVKEIFHHNNS